MTLAISTEEVAATLKPRFADSIVESGGDSLLVKRESLFDLASFLKTSPGLDFDYVSSITAVDYYDYFELVYQLISIEHNHSLVLKTRCHDRDYPAVS